MRRALVFALLMVTLSDCAFVRLKSEVARINKAAWVLGVVEGDIEGDAPMFLVHLVGQKKRAIQRLLPTTPEFDLVVRLGEVNDVAAFQDLDGDLIYDPGEPCGFMAQLEGLESLGKKAVELPPLILDRKALLPVTLDLSHARSSPGGTVGEIVPLNDPRYEEDRVSEGMWTPFRATRRGDHGIHFLEPHQAGRLPVLFIHGINGSPRNFEKLIEHLDRTKYEPWVAYYPSGIRLPVLSQILAGLLIRLKESYDVPRIFIVAHSMGGLVARSALQQLAAKNQGALIAGLVTLDTPWGGHQSAATALEYVPEAVPSWIDMAPGSKFLKSLPEPRVSVPHHLFFGVGGRISRYDENNDGVVTIESQLVRWAQDQAKSLTGFDESHMGMLQSAEVEAKLWPILEAAR
ncbi:MAG: alpha/beta hydrolase [Archangium sp.]|nr:alpha/beta hydrolase [Archangium sp.]